MSDVWIGIDPGLDGAVAILVDGVAQVWDTPTAKDGKHRQYLLSQMADLLEPYESLRFPKTALDSKVRAKCAIERVHSMPKQGVASSFTFGKGFGLWLGLLAAYEIPFDLVEPTRWKKAMLGDRGKEKEASRLRAQELFPEIDLSLVKHHGRADALLLAEYRRRVG